MDSHLDRSWGHLAHLEDEVPADGLHEQVLLLRAVQVQEDAHEAHEGPERELHAREALVLRQAVLVPAWSVAWGQQGPGDKGRPSRSVWKMPEN